MFSRDDRQAPRLGRPAVSAADLGTQSSEQLRSILDGLEGRMQPLKTQLAELGAEAEAVRGELRRRERAALVEARRSVRSRLGAGEMPSLEAVMGATLPGDETAFDQLTYVRDSATEVRLGYASAAHQQVSFTDGSSTADAADLGAARRLWREGWDFGTAAARGVRIYPAGSRAEKMVPPSEVHVRLPGGTE